MDNKSKKLQLLAIIGCCMLATSINGMGANCRGIFFEPVADGLHATMTSVTALSSFYGVFAAIFMPICCWIYRKMPSKVFLSLMVGMYTLSTVMISFSTEVWHLYLWSSLQGIPGGFLTFYPAQYIIGNWFPDRKGSVLGFVLMFTGLAGMLFNPVLSNFIQRLGWQQAFRIQGFSVLAVALPAALILFKSPAEAGLESAVRKAQDSPKAAADGRTPATVLVMLFLIVIIICSASGLIQHLPKLASDLGFSPSFGALMVSVGMAGNLICKVLFGAANDRLGTRPSTILSALVVALGCALVVTLKSQIGMLIGAFGVGVVLVLVSLQTPLLFRTFCDSRTCDTIYPINCSVNVALCAFSQMFLSMLCQWFGGYGRVYILFALLLVGSCGILLCLRLPADNRK